MNRKMSHEDWRIAITQLSAIRQRLLMADLLDLYELTEMVEESLRHIQCPLAAGAQLEYIAERLPALPSLRSSVLKLAQPLIVYTNVEPPSLTQDNTGEYDIHARGGATADEQSA